MLYIRSVGSEFKYVIRYSHTYEYICIYMYLLDEWGGRGECRFDCSCLSETFKKNGVLFLCSFAAFCFFSFSHFSILFRFIYLLFFFFF